MKSNNKFAGVHMKIEQDKSGWYVKYIIHYMGKQLHTNTILGGRTSNYGGVGKTTRFYILREAKEWAVKNGFTGAVARQALASQVKRKNMNMNMNLAPAWVREVAAAKTGIKTGQFFVAQQPSHNTDGVFTPGKVRVWNNRRSAEFTFGTDVVGCVVTDQNVWEMTR